MLEGERADRRFGKRARMRGRSYVRFRLEQLAEPLGGARRAQQVAIDLGQRAEGARDEAAGEDDSGSSTGLIIGLIVLAGLLGAAGWMGWRRRQTP